MSPRPSLGMWKRVWRPIVPALLLACAAAAAAPTILRAQNVSAEGSSRKVRSRVVPAYPDIARQAHLTGKVRLEASVAADGSVRSVKVIGGSPVLVGASTDALLKWRFEAAGNETTETVEFTFGGLD
jgi:TonB family protein